MINNIYIVYIYTYLYCKAYDVFQSCARCLGIRPQAADTTLDLVSYELALARHRGPTGHISTVFLTMEKYGSRWIL